MAKLASLAVKVGALAFILFLPLTYAVQLQLLGGVWIIQTLPAVLSALYARFFNGWALLAGWVAGIVAAVVGGPELGALVAFVLALLGDLFVNTPFGLSALVACLVAFVAGSIRFSLGTHTRWAVPLLTVVGSVTELGFLDDGAVDFAFASNLFEHLRQEEFATVLEALRWKLALAGTLTILQPNYRFAYREYFDDYTHIAVYSHISLCDFLIANDYEILDAKPRFLPLTIKSRLPVSPLLIRAYLASPVKPGGKQMLIRARPRR